MWKSSRKFWREQMKIEVIKDPNPSIGRIIICEEWAKDMDTAKRIVTDICQNYQDTRTKFLITCGGFLTFDLPERYKGIRDMKEPSEEMIIEIIGEAEKIVDTFLSSELLERLSRCTDYLTLGVDSRKSRMSTTKNYIPETHVELVVLVDTANKTYHWTGKSYPTHSQEKTLIRMPDLKTHFFSSKHGKVMLLGCHDLHVFNNRNWKRTGEWRRNIKVEFREVAKKEQPIFVLHHPHTTVKVKTWLNSWKQLEKMLPSVKEYAGAGVYHENNRKKDKIEEVRRSTKKGPTVDFIVS
jgi:hypothetical protein